MNRGPRLRSDKIHLQSDMAVARVVDEDRVIWNRCSGGAEETERMRVRRALVLCMLYRGVLGIEVRR